MDGRHSSDTSPLGQKRGGILKGGRLWKSIENEKDFSEEVCNNMHNR